MQYGRAHIDICAVSPFRRSRLPLVTGLTLVGLALCLTLSAGRAFAVDPPAKQTYTLQECRQAALNNPDAVKRWALRADKFAADVSLAKSDLGVSVRAGARAITSLNNEAVAEDTSPLISQGERARVEVTARYTLYDTGKRLDALHAARAALRGTQNTLLADRLSLIQAVTDAYYTTLRCQRLAESAGLLIQAAQQHLKQAQSRFEVGVVTRGDALVAQSALDAARAEALARTLRLASSRTHLANLMGNDPAHSAPDVVPPSAEPAIQLSAEELIAKALQNSPELARIGADKDRVRAGLSATRAERSPTVSAAGGTGYIFRGSANAEAISPFLYVSLGVSLPLSEGAAIRARERSLTDQLQLNDLSARQAVNDLKETVLAASAAYQTGIARITPAAAAVQAAEEAARLAQERYAVGKGAQGDVIDALQRLAAARDLLANALNDRDEAAENLRWITGLYTLPAAPLTGTPHTPSK